MTDSSANVPLATYDLIGTWIGQQKQAPAPLTDRLRSAIVGLETALKAESVSLLEPELGDINWIGLLQEYRAAFPFNGSIEVLFTESSFDPTGRGPLRWKCQVSIIEAPGASFPAADVNQPTFARKKDAKKYAAKCAVEWLREKNFMPQDGVRFPKGMVSAHQHRQQQQQQTQGSPATPAPRRGQPQPQPASPPVATTNANANAAVVAIPQSPFDASQQSAVYQVSELCKDLGYPAPAYRIDSDGGGFFSGSANFGDHRDLLPFDPALSAVRGGLGNKATREMVAESLLVPLRAEKRKRDAETEAFMAQYAKGDKE
ncbi:hypothetical protein F5Y14DRAFT_212386 [Nemania sp. NC0429]|nr:hypothetical protein F5Y14DRAFT_212386 [Nemania sp. NC0429]